MPVEPRAGDAAAHLVATARAVVLHRQRVLRGVAGNASGCRLREQLHGDVPDDGLRHAHVRAAPAPQPDTGRRQTRVKLPRSGRCTTNPAKNLIPLRIVWPVAPRALFGFQ